MTDIPAAPTTVPSLNLPRPSFPRLAIGATLSAVFDVMGAAFKLAYVAPYTSLGRRPPVAPDDDLEGRDPTW